MELKHHKRGGSYTFEQLEAEALKSAEVQKTPAKAPEPAPAKPADLADSK